MPFRLPKIPESVTSDPLWRMTFLGFYAGPPNMKKWMLCMCIPQILGVFFCGYMYYTYNGGLIPYFLRNELKSTAISAIHPLHHFPDAQGDGSRITWAHGVNNKKSLEEALKSKINFLENFE